MPVINLWGRHENEWIKPKHTLYFGGLHYNQTPCPLDEETYQLAVHKRILEVARLSHAAAIEGVVIDPEMYGANLTNFPEYCLCDHCFNLFAENEFLELPLRPELRQDYLIRTKKINSYRVFTEKTIEMLTAETRKQLASVAPDFKIGIFHHNIARPYYRGILKGLATGADPLLVFTEQTYSTGYSSFIRSLQDEWSVLGVKARLVVGIWQDKFPPENLAEQYYYCAKDSFGYWIYTTESLSRNMNKVLPFNKNQYWQAIREANNELDKLEKYPDYKSSLRIRSFLPPSTVPNISNINITSVQYVGKTSLVPGVKIISDLSFRQKTTLVFIARQREEINFKISMRKYGQNNVQSAIVVLSNYSGEQLAHSLVTFQKNAELRFTAPYTGAYATAFNPGGNAAKVVSYSHPFSIVVNETVGLLGPKQSLFLWKPAGSMEARLWLEVDGPGESVVATFKKGGGAILGEYDILHRHNITLALHKNQQGEIIELIFRPRPGAVLEDVRLKVDSGLGKYMSLSKDSLLRDIERQMPIPGYVH